MFALPAQAHLNSTGMGPFYDGLMHFLTSPEDLVPVLALALLAGLRGGAYGRRNLVYCSRSMAPGGTHRTHGRCRQPPPIRRSLLVSAPGRTAGRRRHTLSASYH